MENFLIDVDKAIFKLIVLPRFSSHELVRTIIDRSQYDIPIYDLAYSLFVTKENYKYFIEALEKLLREGYIFIVDDEINKYDVIYKDQESCAKENREVLEELRKDIESLLMDKVPKKHYYFACLINKRRNLQKLNTLYIKLDSRLRVLRIKEDFLIVPDEKILADLYLLFDNIEILGEISPPDLYLGEIINPISKEKIRVKIVEKLYVLLNCVLKEGKTSEED